MSGAKFVGIFDKHVQESKDKPPEQRWFMQDEEDRVFLRTAVVDVFQHPRESRQHAMEFYRACDVRVD